MATEIIIGIAAAIIILFVITVALQPSEFKVVRSAAITATPAEVFAQVNDFHHWEAWSPWAKIDPDVMNVYDGSPSGSGAIFTWSGNSKVGEGTMTLTESSPTDLIRIKLEFRRPFKAANAVEFTFNPTGNQTMATWSMVGRKNFIVKAFGLFMSMDKMVGKQFEQGLTNLNSVVTRESIS